MKKIFSGLAILCLLGAGVQAHAREGEDRAEIDASINTGVTAPLPKLPIRADIKANRDAIKTEVQIKRASTTEIRGDRKEVREEMREDRKDARASSSEVRKEVRASTTAARKDARRENVEKNISSHASRMTERLNAAVDRFEKIIVRLDSRIAKLKAEGKVTTDAEKFEAEAKVSIASAKSSIATIPDVLAAALAREKLAGSFGDLEKLAISIRKDLISAHKSLVSAVTSLKTLGGDTNVRTNTSVDAPAQ